MVNGLDGPMKPIGENADAQDFNALRPVQIVIEDLLMAAKVAARSDRVLAVHERLKDLVAETMRELIPVERRTKKPRPPAVAAPQETTALPQIPAPFLGAVGGVLRAIARPDPDGPECWCHLSRPIAGHSGSCIAAGKLYRAITGELNLRHKAEPGR